MTGTQMDLNTVANIAEIIGVLIVIGGFAFAVIQILQFRRQRRDMSALELARSFNNPEFARAVRLVLSLPSGITAAELREEDPRYEDAAWLVGLTLETVGIMVYKQIISVEMVWELMGGVSQSIWEKLGNWVADLRKEQRQEKLYEWLEWLATVMKKFGREEGGEPAHRRPATWKT